MAVQVRHEILGHVPFPVSRGHRIRVHATAVRVHAVRHDEDHLFGSSAREHALGNDMQLPARGPEVTQVGARVAVKQVHHRIASRTVCGVAWRQIDRDLRLGGFAHQVAFEGPAVHLRAHQRALERHRRRRRRAGARGLCRLPLRVERYGGEQRDRGRGEQSGRQGHAVPRASCHVSPS
jgi:hypothetical protein